MTWGPNSTDETATVDGITTVWTVTIPFINVAWLKVYQSDGATFMTDVTSLASIAVAADPATGGTVTITPALAVANGAQLIFMLNCPLQQTALHLGPNDELPSETAESAWDYAIMLIAQLAEIVGRCAVLPEYLGLSGPVLPAPNVGNYLQWGGSGQLVNAPGTGAIARGTFTLTPNATSTLVHTGAATLCTPTSHIGYTVLAGGFAGDVASGELSFTPANGSFTISHPNNPGATRSANYVIV